MLDLFAGRLGVAKVFLNRGWQVTAVDLVEPPDLPDGMTFFRRDVLLLGWRWVRDNFDFGWASSVCDGFASFGMKHFRPNPPYPAHEIELFNHTRQLFEDAGIPYIMENVRSAQQFVGPAVAHCGPFYLWGNAVPPILPQGITKTKWYRRPGKPGNFAAELNWSKAERKAKLATIPPELANCVAQYAEAVLELRQEFISGEYMPNDTQWRTWLTVYSPDEIEKAIQIASPKYHGKYISRRHADVCSYISGILKRRSEEKE